jgi:hypothetical protein
MSVSGHQDSRRYFTSDRSTGGNAALMSRSFSFLATDSERPEGDLRSGCKLLRKENDSLSPRGYVHASIGKGRDVGDGLMF